MGAYWTHTRNVDMMLVTLAITVLTWLITGHITVIGMSECCTAAGYIDARRE